MNKTVWSGLKNMGIFLIGAFVMIFSYSREADNKRSPNRAYSSGKNKYPHPETFPVTIEKDSPEISSGTQ